MRDLELHVVVVVEYCVVEVVLVYKCMEFSCETLAVQCSLLML